MSSNDWEQRKLGELGSLKNGMNFSKEAMGIGFPFVNLQNIFGNNVIDVTNLGKAMASDSQLKDYNLLNGDVLFVRSSVKLEGVGEAALVPQNLENTTYSGFIIRFRDEYGLDNNFKRFLFGIESVRNQIMAQATNSANKNISQTVLENLCLKIPNKSEQEKIGLYFSDIDHLITLHHRKCEETKKLKKFMLQKMFPKKGEKVPDIRFDGFTDDWEQRKFSDVVDIGNGMDYKHLEEGNIPVYGTGGYMLSVNKALSDDKDAIGIGRKGTIDKPYILRAPFWTVDTLFYCIPKENYDLDFTSCIFQNVDWKKKDESTGVPSLSKVIINNVETATPTVEEQKKIGDYFRSLDHLITLHQQKCDELRNVKKFMLQNMFI